MIRELENFCVEKRLFFQVGKTETAAADFFATHGGGIFVIVGAPKVGATTAEVLVRGAAANFIDDIKQLFRRSGSTFVQNGQRFSVTSKIKRPFASGGAGIITNSTCFPTFPSTFGISAKKGTGQARISFDWDDTDTEGYVLASYLFINIGNGQLTENIVKNKEYQIGEINAGYNTPSAILMSDPRRDVQQYRVTIHEGEIEIGGDCNEFYLESPLAFSIFPESKTIILPISIARMSVGMSINNQPLTCVQRSYYQDTYYGSIIREVWLYHPDEYSFNNALSMLRGFGFERPDRAIYVSVGSKWDNDGYGERLYNTILNTPSIIATAIDQEGEYIRPYIPVYKFNIDLCE